MSEPFSKTLYARWGDMDFNGHMKNTAYLDASADVRMFFFEEFGFSMREFESRRFGPVILRDDLEYFRELRLLEPVRVTFESSGFSEDYGRYRLVNQFFKLDGHRVARVTTHGLWLNLDTRKPMAPPDDLRKVMEQIFRTDDYEVLSQRR